jgi:hypothetical protein
MASQHVEFYLRWCQSIIKTHSGALLAADNVHGGQGLRSQESLRSLIRAVSKHEKEIMAACDLNQYNLCFLAQQVTAETTSEGCSGADESEPVAIEEAASVDEVRVASKSKPQQQIKRKKVVKN